MRVLAVHLVIILEAFVAETGTLAFTGSAFVSCGGTSVELLMFSGGSSGFGVFDLGSIDVIGSTVGKTTAPLQIESPLSSPLRSAF